MFTGIVQAVGRIVRTRPLEVECADLDLTAVAVKNYELLEVALSVSEVQLMSITKDEIAQ